MATQAVRNLPVLGLRFVDGTLPQGRAADDLPLVSVVIPAHNREDLLPRALASVHAQDLGPSEIIVVDDGSTDGTAEVALAAGARVIRLDTNRGASAARTRGVREARFPWIALLDSDDEWLPWTLSTLWPRRGDHAIVAGASVWIRERELMRYEGLPFGSAAELSSPESLVWPQNFIPAAGVLVRRDAMLAAAEEGSTYRFSEDFASWLRILRRETALVVARPVVRYHLHSGQKTVSQERLRDQHAIVQETLGASSSGGRALRRRMHVDAWDRWLTLGRPAGDLRRHLRPGRLASITGAVAWRLAQDRRCRALTPDLDLDPGRWSR